MSVLSVSVLAGVLGLVLAPSGKRLTCAAVWFVFWPLAGVAALSVSCVVAFVLIGEAISLFVPFHKE